MTTRYVGRVNKLDALQLDASIRQIIQDQQFQLKDGVFDRLQDFQKQINFITSSAIWWYSVKSRQATLGQQLLALKYDSNQLTRKAAIWHYILTVLLPNSFQMGNSDNPVVKWLENVLIMARIWIFFKFCYTGVRPSVTDQFLGLDLQSTQIKRTVSYGYMNRELIWNGFIEFLVYTIPMINFQLIRNRFRRIVRGSKEGVYQKPTFDLETLCVYCQERPTHPHHMGCGHIYCYYCLMGNVQADARFACVECGCSGRIERLS